MTDNKQNMIDRYIRGEMNVEEKSLFEKQLETDEELLEMYRYTQRICRAVRDRNEKLEKISRWKTEGSKEKFHNTFAGKVVYVVISVAAILAVVLYVSHRPSMPELDTTKYECYRGGNDVVAVADLINEKQYEKALSTIETIEKTSKSDIDSVNRMIPLASEEQKMMLDYELSAINLDVSEVMWLKVYALMGLDRYDEAVQLLKNISVQKGLYSEKADSILDNIN